MKESAEIPLNPIISSSLDNNNGSEHLINDNSNISTNTLIKTNFYSFNIFLNL